jgi:hypothetical protein
VDHPLLAERVGKALTLSQWLEKLQSNHFTYPD